MTQHRFLTHHLVLIGLATAFAACGTRGDEPVAVDVPDHEAAAALRERFPGHAAEVLRQPETFVSTQEGLSLRSRDGSSAERRLELTLPHDGATAARLRAPGNFEVRVRERDVHGRATVTESAVSYRRAGGTSFWTAVADGHEEWLHLSGVRAGEVAATWEIDGASVQQAGDEIALVDESGIPRILVNAPAAYAVGGEKVAVTLKGEGTTIALYVEAAGEVLVDPGWRAAATMIKPRYGHTATVLPGGDVLVAGGYNSVTATYEASSEVYVPSTNRWMDHALMNHARYAHTATRLPDDTVLVTGGWDGQALSSAEIYDHSAKSWTPVSTPMAAAHHSHTATLLMTNKVLVVGGIPENGTPEIYDPADQSFHPTEPMGTVRQGHTATLLPTGKLLVAGGLTWGVGALSSTELYDPFLDQWQPGPPLITGRVGHTAVTLGDGRILVAGGRNVVALASAELYDLLPDPVGSWTPALPMHSGRDSHAATVLGDGKVLLTGGFTTSLQPHATTELFDPVSNTWGSPQAMRIARNQHTATLLGDGSVLVAGGFGNGYPASAELYDPRLDPTCLAAPSQVRSNSNSPLHAPGPCPAVPEYTLGDAVAECGGGTVKYFSGTCSNLAFGTHAFTSYFACCAPEPTGGLCTEGSQCQDGTCGDAITFETRFLTPGTPYPTNKEEAIATFKGLPRSHPGYGRQVLNRTAGFHNRLNNSLYDTSNFASHLEVSFTIPSGTPVKSWRFRLGPDYGLGGTLLVDRRELESFWLPPGAPPNAQGITWGGSFANPSNTLEGTIALGPGVHVIEAYGFENCCDGAMELDFLAPDLPDQPGSWKPISAATAELHLNGACAPQRELLVVVAARLVQDPGVAKWLGTYVEDLAHEGWRATIKRVSLTGAEPNDHVCADAPALKAVIKAERQRGVDGFVLVGSPRNLPTALWHRNQHDTWTSPSDLYYADVDHWVDLNGDGVFDSYKDVDNTDPANPQNPEYRTDMIYARIGTGANSPNDEDEAQKIGAYFARLHTFRVMGGNLSPSARSSMLLMADDDWSAQKGLLPILQGYPSSQINALFDLTLTRRDRALEELHRGAFYAQLIVHSASTSSFGYGEWHDGVGSGNVLSRADIEGADARVNILNIASCGASDITQVNAASAFLFHNAGTINVIGNYGSWSYNLDATAFDKLGAGVPIGEVYSDYFRRWAQYDINFPMAVLYGDPTLRYPAPTDAGNHPPAITTDLHSLQIGVGQVFTLPILATDPEGQPVTVTIGPSLPPGMSFDGTTLSWTPTLAQAGQDAYPLTVTATDPGGASYVEDFTIYVSHFKDPALETLAGWTISGNAPFLPEHERLLNQDAWFAAPQGQWTSLAQTISVAQHTTYELLFYAKMDPWIAAPDAVTVTIDELGVTIVVPPSNDSNRYALRTFCLDSGDHSTLTVRVNVGSATHLTSGKVSLIGFRLNVLTNTICDSCSNGACANGTCTSTPEGPVCECPPDWMGPTCAVYNFCTAFHPCENGECVIDEGGSFTCVCPPHYYGTFCSQSDEW